MILSSQAGRIRQRGAGWVLEGVRGVPRGEELPEVTFPPIPREDHDALVSTDRMPEAWKQVSSQPLPSVVEASMRRAEVSLRV